MEHFPIQIKFPIAWGDMDAFGHVNNVVYFRWFESARMAYFEKIRLEPTKALAGVGPILAHTSCQFLLPLQYPDTVTAKARIKSMGNTSFVMQYEIVSDAKGIAAMGEGVVVMIDYTTNKKVPLPAEMRAAIKQLEA